MMGLFDNIEGVAGQFIGGDAHEALDNALQQSPLGGVDGLLSKLQEGGLAAEVESWCQGGGLPVGPDQIRDALGEAHVQALASSLGISTDQVLATLSQHLPTLAAASNDQ
jgi:uncharacterized protein YidB (DUF937 family)